MSLSYKEKLYAIRPYVNVDYDARKQFSRKQKWVISYYFNQINNLNLKYTEKYRPTSKKGKALGKAAAGVTGAKWKALPIRTVMPGSKFSVKNGKLRITNGMVGGVDLYPLNQVILHTEGAHAALKEAGVPRKLKPAPEGKAPPEEYQVTMGGHPANGRTTSYKVLVQIIDDYIMQYISDDEDAKNPIIGAAIMRYGAPTKEAKARFDARANSHQKKKVYKRREGRGKKRA